MVRLTPTHDDGSSGRASRKASRKADAQANAQRERRHTMVIVGFAIAGAILMLVITRGC